MQLYDIIVAIREKYWYLFKLVFKQRWSWSIIMELLPNDAKNMLPTATLSKILNAGLLLVTEYFYISERSEYFFHHCTSLRGSKHSAVQQRGTPWDCLHFRFHI